MEASLVKQNLSVKVQVVENNKSSIDKLADTGYVAHVDELISSHEKGVVQSDIAVHMSDLISDTRGK